MRSLSLKSCGIFLLSSLPHIASSQVLLDAYRTEGGVKRTVSDVTSSSEPVGMQLFISADQNFSGTLEYSQNGKTLGSLKIELTSGDVYSFPNQQSSIELSEIGSHTFSLLNEKSEAIETRSILILPNPPRLGLLPESDLKKDEQGTVQLTSQNYQPARFNNVKSDINLRGVGTQIFKQVADSVVLVALDDGFGTGSIISNEGHVLTNWHVVGEEDEAAVIFRPKGFDAIENAEAYTADVIYTSPENDLALLKIRNLKRKVTPVPLEASTNIEIAEDVHAIGHPHGEFWTYTNGVISQIRPQYEWTGDGVLYHHADILQTQTPINPGNSGGPLLNDKGNMIGVNSFVDTEAQGLNYAVAISTVQEFVDYAIKLEPKEKQSNAEREEKVIHSRDTNNDGKVDEWYIDTNFDNVFDTVKIDADYNGSEDYIYIDENQNGTYELTIYYDDYSDPPMTLIYFDENEDGTNEQIGYDFDQDGYIDKYENT